jgi:5'-3' exonuclease
MGVCTLNAPGEAEKCLAHMQRSDIIDHIFTEDSDTLACGAHSYIKNSGKLPTDHTGTLVELRPVLDTLNLTYDEFLTFCVLCGCDFAPKIAKVGPVKALKLVGEHKENIETCIQAAAPSTTSDVIARFQAARLLLSYDPNFEIPAIISDHDPLQLDALCEELGDRSFTAMFTRHISNSFVTAPCRREFATETTVETVLVTPQ